MRQIATVADVTEVVAHCHNYYELYSAFGKSLCT
jgi:hypothetical protein